MEQVDTETPQVVSFHLNGLHGELEDFSLKAVKAINNSEKAHLYLEAYDFKVKPNEQTVDHLKAVLNYIRYFDKVAVVTDKSWISYTFELRGRVLGVNVKTYPSADKQEALLWAEC